MAKPTVVDTLNAALGLADTGGESPNAGEESGEGGDADAGDDSGSLEEDDSGANADGGDDEPGEEGDEEEEEEDGEGEEGAEGEGERNPDGTFKKKAGEKPAEKPGEKPAEKPGEKRKPDAVNDPIPKDLKQETRQRMETLVKTAKELTVERDEVRQQFGTFVGGLQAANVTPEQYGETLSWLGMFNSGDPTQQEKALELIEGIADRLSTMLGKERSTSDPLKSHADLVQAVQTGKVTKEYAAEIARTRNAQGFQREMALTAQQRQQQDQQAAQELHVARSDLTALEETLRATDPDFERKKAILVPALKPIMKAIPPSQWKAKFLESYRAVNVGRINAGGTRKNVVPKNQPMRAGKQPSGGRAAEVSNPLDAMNGALQNMGK